MKRGEGAANENHRVGLLLRYRGQNVDLLANRLSWFGILRGTETNR